MSCIGGMNRISCTGVSSASSARAGDAKAWIGIIARNCALDMGRRRLPASETGENSLESLEAVAVEPPDPKLGKCLGQLPDDQPQSIPGDALDGMNGRFRFAD